MLECVLFDLDDTLYPEADFFRSGMDAVSVEVERRFGIKASQARVILTRQGRDRTIDRALSELGIAAEGLVPELVQVYRTHPPKITLFPDARDALQRLASRGLRLGLVTDGEPQTQRSKARALELDRWMGAQVFTWDDGPQLQKPHPQGYERALRALAVEAHCAAYVGDNPAKDFAGARALGLRTVRIRRGPHAPAIAEPGFGADAQIDDFDMLEQALGLL